MALPQEHGLGHPYVPPKPFKPKLAGAGGYNPFANLGIEGSGFATRNDAVVEQPAPPPVAPPPPIDFNAETLKDPEFTTGQALLARNNTMNLKTLKDAFLRNTQGAQDNANAHGALFSGAAANAQAHLTDDYANPVNGALAQQALNFDQGGHGLYFSVFNRLKQQAANALGGQ